MAHPPSKSRNLQKKHPRPLNLIPIMNLFIVVIPMLMMIMVSVHLALIEIALPAAAEKKIEQEDQEEPPPRIILALLPDKFEILVGEDEEYTIPVKDVSDIFAKYDYNELNERMSELKTEYNEQNTIDILPDPSVKYDILLKSIDICKFNGFPAIKYLTSTRKIFRAKQKGGA